MAMFSHALSVLMMPLSSYAINATRHKRVTDIGGAAKHGADNLCSKG